MKCYLPTLKHLVIQLAKLQIYTLNLTTTFWHCQKKSHYFWTGVYVCNMPFVDQKHNSGVTVVSPLPVWVAKECQIIIALRLFQLLQSRFLSYAPVNHLSIIGSVCSMSDTQRRAFTWIDCCFCQGLDLHVSAKPDEAGIQVIHSGKSRNVYFNQIWEVSWDDRGC